MKQPLISVIIPVYKVYDFIDNCIESIVKQKYSNLEIILVDDGSSDGCAIKCDEWTRKDSRITIIHKQNGGLSDARNYGMKMASGEYISFIDSDDFISEDFFEILISTALKHGSDIAECSYADFYESGIIQEYKDDLFESDFSAFDGLSALIDENPFHQHVWDKIYKKEVVKDIFFEVGKQHEDAFWTYQIFGEAERITKINHTMYFYLQRESSIMGKGYSLKSLDFLEGKWNRLKYIEKRFPELELKAKLDFFGSCMYMMQCVIKYMSGSEKRKAIATIKHYKRMCRLTFKDIRAVQSGARKYYYLAKINIYLCCKLRAKLNIGF